MGLIKAMSNKVVSAVATENVIPTENVIHYIFGYYITFSVGITFSVATLAQDFTDRCTCIDSCTNFS